MKNIEITSATALTSPIKTKTKAITLVRIVAFLGSFFFGVPLATHLFTVSLGNTSSLPIAYNVLGATIKEPKAEEIVAAANPIGIIGPQ